MQTNVLIAFFEVKREMKKLLNIATYIYIITTLFEGIFRKWILPQFSTPLMAVKQIIGCTIFSLGIGYWKYFTAWEKSSILIGIIAFFSTMLFGHGNLAVAIYGCLPMIFGIPLCLIISKVFEEQDVIKIGKLFVVVAFVNCVFLIIQYNLPITHFLNFMAGDSSRIEEMSISELAGGFRPSGLFYHSTHNALFSLIGLSFVLYFYFYKRSINFFGFLGFLVLDIIACLCSVSRTNVLMHIGLILVFFILVAKKREKRQTVITLIIFICAISLVSRITNTYKSAVTNMSNRFEQASEAQYRGASTTQGTLNDIWYRGVQYQINAIIDPKTFDEESPPFWGFGQGMSTQIGGQILGVGEENSGFSLGEFDGLRIMCESGLLVGWIIIYIRLGYAFRFLFSIARMKRRKQFLALCLLFSFITSFYLLNNWGNLFTANMAFIVGGLFLTSYKSKLTKA